MTMQSKRESNKYETGAARRGQAMKGLGGRGKEFSPETKSNEKPLTCRVENVLETGKSSFRHVS